MHPIDARDLARVWGGFDLDQMLDAGNATAEKTSVAGGFLGAGYGAIKGTRAHMAGAKSFVGIKKFPAHMSGPAAYGIGGVAGAAALGWVYGAGRNVVCQLSGVGCPTGGISTPDDK